MNVQTPHFFSKLRKITCWATIPATVVLVYACGGGGGGENLGSNTVNPLVAAQISDLQPDNETDTNSVFVKLGNASTPVDGAGIVTDSSRDQLQTQFLEDLKNAAGSKVLLGAASTPACDTTGFAQQLENAHKFGSDAFVGIHLTKCQLNLLSTLPNVQGVYPDIILNPQSASAPDFTRLNSAIDFSFNATSSRQVATSASGNTKTADGNGVVIAVMDTGVEERHPALGSAKVLPGACFSTASNGGASFCLSGNTYIEPSDNKDDSKRAARSCADATYAGTSVWSSRQEAINATCSHGTAMASAAAMGSMASTSNTAGVKVNGGIAPQVKILPIQVFSKSGSGINASSRDLIAALDWLVTEAQRRKNNNLPPLVAVNLSLGGGSYPQNCDADGGIGALAFNTFSKLRALGVLPVVAAGNSGTKSAISFPACASNAFSVAASQLDGQTIAAYSNFNNQVKLFSLGGDSNGTYALPTLCATVNNFDCWDSIAGTSPATALVSGGVAALASLNLNATLADIESALTSATGGSAKTVTVGNISKPALRITASGYKLMGLSESAQKAPAPSPAPTPNNPMPIQQARVCIYPKANYQGVENCRNIIAFGSADVWVKLSTKVGSVKIEPLASSASVTLFHYAWQYETAAAHNDNLQGFSIRTSLNDTSQLFGAWSLWSIPTVYGMRIQSPAK